MNMLPRLRPRNFFDLVVEISLVRPGPIQGEMVHPYLRRREGKEKIEYAHPMLESILKKRTVFRFSRNRSWKMAMQVAGFSPGEADELRRAMGSWRRTGGNRLTKWGMKFCAASRQRNASEFAEKVFHQIEGSGRVRLSRVPRGILLDPRLRHGLPEALLSQCFPHRAIELAAHGFYSSHSLIHDGERHGVRIVPHRYQSLALGQPSRKIGRSATGLP